MSHEQIGEGGAQNFSIIKYLTPEEVLAEQQEQLFKNQKKYLLELRLRDTIRHTFGNQAFTFTDTVLIIITKNSIYETALQDMKSQKSFKLNSKIAESLDLITKKTFNQFIYLNQALNDIFISEAKQYLSKKLNITDKLTNLITRRHKSGLPFKIDWKNFQEKYTWQKLLLDLYYNPEIQKNLSINDLQLNKPINKEYLKENINNALEYQQQKQTLLEQYYKAYQNENN